MLRLLKVARPLAAATVLRPPRAPLFGLVPIATVMLFVAPVTRLPFASSTSTVTAGVIVAPPVVEVGGWTKPSFVAVPADKVIVLEVAAVRLPEVKRSV